MKRLIIWLFERYCWNDWVEMQEREGRRELAEKYNLESEEEIDRFVNDRHEAPLREAYYQGVDDGRMEVLKDKP